jgi:hypothetical protein
MVNWKLLEWKRSWPNFQVLSRLLHEGTEENLEKSSVRIAGLRAAV